VRYVGGKIEAKPSTVPKSIAVAHPIAIFKEKKQKGRFARNIERVSSLFPPSSGLNVLSVLTCEKDTNKGDTEVDRIGHYVEVDERHHDLDKHVQREPDAELKKTKNVSSQEWEKNYSTRHLPVR